MKGKSEKQHDHDHYYMYIGGNLQSTAVTEKVLTYYFSYTCFLDTCNLSIHYNLDSTNFKATIYSADSSSLSCTVLRAQYSFLYTYTRITTYTTHCGSDFQLPYSWKYWQCFYYGRLAVVTSYRQNLTATNNSFLGV